MSEQEDRNFLKIWFTIAIFTIVVTFAPVLGVLLHEPSFQERAIAQAVESGDIRPVGVDGKCYTIHGRDSKLVEFILDQNIIVECQREKDLSELLSEVQKTAEETTKELERVSEYVEKSTNYEEMLWRRRMYLRHELAKIEIILNTHTSNPK